MAEEGKYDKKPKSNPQQERAEADGWQPEDQWAGEPGLWVDYKEFNVRGELMGRIQEQSSIISNQKGQIDEVKTALADLSSMQDKIATAQYNKLLQQLRDQKAQAIDDSDGAAVTEIEEQIDALTEQHEEVVKSNTGSDGGGGRGGRKVASPL